MDTVDRPNISKYFSILGAGAIIFLIIGIVLALIGLIISSDSKIGIGVAVLGGVIALLCILVIRSHSSGMPTDHDINNVIGNDLIQYRQKALDLLGLIDDQVVGETVYLWGPLYEDFKSIKANVSRIEGRFKKGGDGCYRFSRYRVMVLIPTEQHLGVFSCVHNLISNIYGDSATGEYFYKDVVSIRTEQNETLKLTFTDGHEFSISLPGDETSKEIYKSTNIPFISFDDAAQSIRKMIQMHKQL